MQDGGFLMMKTVLPVPNLNRASKAIKKRLMRLVRVLNPQKMTLLTF